MTIIDHPGASVDEPSASHLLQHYLERLDVPHEVIFHTTTASAEAEAHAAQVPADEMAKTVVLHDPHGFLLAVVPASRRVDVEHVARVVGSDGLRLATEDEIAGAFLLADVGALAPLGPGVSTVEVIDRSLLGHRRVVCSGGDHRHAIRLDPRDLVRLAGAEVADVCAD